MVKKLLSKLLTLVLVLGLLPVTGAAAESTRTKFQDMPDNWATESLEYAVEKDWLNGYEDGTIRPESLLTRAEMATIVVRAFGYTEEGDISRYTDVKKEDWYYSSIAKVFNMKVMEGDAGLMRPNDSITRQEAFAVLARALKLDPASSMNMTFKDSGDISIWFEDEIYALVNAGYIHGSDDGKLNPLADIKRNEFAKVMFNAKDQIAETPVIPDPVAVVAVSAIDETTLEVTLSDDSTVEITDFTPSPLKDGVETRVEFEYDGKPYVFTVTWNKAVSDKLEDAKAELEAAKKDLEAAKADEEAKQEARDEAYKARFAAEQELVRAEKFGTEEEKEAAQKALDEAIKVHQKSRAEHEEAITAVTDAENKVADLEKQVAELKAEAAVEKAEGSFEQDDVDAARNLVDETPHTNVDELNAKNALISRLVAVETTIEKIGNIKIKIRNLPNATDVKLTHEAAITEARTNLDKLPEAAKAKVTNIKFLEAAEEALEALKNDAAIEEVEKYIKHAKAYLEEDNLDLKEAQDGIDAAKTKLKDVTNEDDKARLQDEIDELQEEVNENAAEKAVENAEKFEDGTGAYINYAQELIDELDDGDVKDALQARLDKVQKELNEAAAIDAVKLAEGNLENNDYAAALVRHNQALELVKALDEGEVKTDLLERLAKVEAAVQKEQFISSISVNHSNKLRPARTDSGAIRGRSVFVEVVFKEWNIKDMTSLEVTILMDNERLSTMTLKDPKNTDASSTSGSIYENATETGSWTIDKNLDLTGKSIGDVIYDGVEVKVVIDGETYIFTE